MARKSKQTICFEQLCTFSKCPRDIFTTLSPDDNTLSLIRSCEALDPSALTEATEALYRGCITDAPTPQKSDALVYLCLLGLRAGEESCLSLLTRYIDRTENSTELLYSLRTPLGGDDEALSARLEAKAAISQAARCGGDYGELTSRLDQSPEHLTVMLFIYHITRPKDDRSVKELIDLCKRYDCLSLLSLPAMGLGDAVKTPPTDGAIPLMLKAPSVSTSRDWHDFWLKMLYEDAVTYRGSDYTHFASEAWALMAKREHNKLREHHTLAFLRYATKRSDDESLQQKYITLVNKCKFGGDLPDIENDDVVEELIRQAVYTSKPDEKELADKSYRRGIIIQRGKNRFYAEGSLIGHAKRGRKHLWRAIMSFPKANASEAPSFSTFEIEQTSNVITRFGTRVLRDGSSSQIICRSTLYTGDQPHPFMLDFVLDISYVSASKCGSGEICIRSVGEDDEFYLYDCAITIC